MRLAFAAVVFGALGCIKPATMTPPAPMSWSPGTTYQTARGANARGLLDRRGLIHAHSIHSHDACDNAPRDDAGVYNAACEGDFRRDLCASKHDFVFLTDHPTSFKEVEFPETVLYRADKGDRLVEHDGAPTASWLACADGTTPLIMAGTESSPMMPVGLERHATDRRTYDHEDAAAYTEMKSLGGVALVAHTERWTPEQLTTLPLDGFEMFNLHRNAIFNGGIAAELVIGKVDRGDFEGLPVPDAFFTSFRLDDPIYFETWGTTFARGAKRVTTMGTDCHRNSFPQLLQDGVRVDSYRRMMNMFSNHLLVRPHSDGTFDDRDLKDALRARRLFGSFDFLGTPVGFDFVAMSGGSAHEMGESLSLANGVELVVTVPTLRDLDPAAPAPVITTHLWRAREGGWDEVATTSEKELRFTVQQAGAYRAEVRITPTHLRPFIGKRGDFIREDRPWVYSNVIWVE